ncbi:agmatinase [Bacteroidales bacterium OttesenSCG-928-A14]|nr:agmatinase [Bacteroidales bacterium OttesenSCG-928-A14]
MDQFLDMPAQFHQPENAKYFILPVAYDGTSTFVKGADKGPQAILDASDSLELYDVMYDREACAAGIHTLCQPFDFSAPEHMVEGVYAEVKSILSLRKFPIIIGGEHSVSIGAIKALSETYANLSVLQIDAHADLRDEYHGSAYNHACVMRRAQEMANVVQVGIRSVCIEEKPNIVEENIFYAHKIHNRKSWMNEAVERLTDSVYLTIDLDGLDPAYLPATGTPQPGGLAWYDLLEFIELVIKSKKIVGFDIVELCPMDGDKSSDVLAASLLYKIITLLEIYP